MNLLPEDRLETALVETEERARRAETERDAAGEALVQLRSEQEEWCSRKEQLATMADALEIAEVALAEAKNDLKARTISFVKLLAAAEMREQILTADRDAFLGERDRLIRQLADLRSALAMHWSDASSPEDGEIRAAHPTVTGRHDLYATAMRMVSVRRSKGAIVLLVNWLLYRAEEK